MKKSWLIVLGVLFSLNVYGYGRDFKYRDNVSYWYEPDGGALSVVCKDGRTEFYRYPEVRDRNHSEACSTIHDRPWQVLVQCYQSWQAKDVRPDQMRARFLYDTRSQEFLSPVIVERVPLLNNFRGAVNDRGSEYRVYDPVAFKIIYRNSSYTFYEVPGIREPIKINTFNSDTLGGLCPNCTNVHRDFPIRFDLHYKYFDNLGQSHQVDASMQCIDPHLR